MLFGVVGVQIGLDINSIGQINVTIRRLLRVDVLYYLLWEAVPGVELRWARVVAVAEDCPCFFDFGDIFIKRLSLKVRNSNCSGGRATLQCGD